MKQSLSLNVSDLQYTLPHNCQIVWLDFFSTTVNPIMSALNGTVLSLQSCVKSTLSLVKATIISFAHGSGVSNLV